MDKVKLTQEIVRDLIDYDIETGKVFWKFRDKKWFREGGEGRFSQKNISKKWNGRYAGKEVSCKDDFGYIRISLFNNQYLLHRIIWFYVYGEWPKTIDHINGDKSDNRIINLRSVTQKENLHNIRKCSRNTSGVNGVSWYKKYNKWRVYIQVNNRFKSLGYFDSIEEAEKVRKEAEIKYGYHPNHGRK